MCVGVIFPIIVMYLLDVTINNIYRYLNVFYSLKHSFHGSIIYVYVSIIQFMQLIYPFQNWTISSPDSSRTKYFSFNLNKCVNAY